MGNKFLETLYCIGSTLPRRSDRLPQSSTCRGASPAPKVRHRAVRSTGLRSAAPVVPLLKEQSPSRASRHLDDVPWQRRRRGRDSQKPDPRSLPILSELPIFSSIQHDARKQSPAEIHPPP